MTLSRNVRETLAFALASLVAAFLILDRWIVTDLGVRSFGRIWAFYINYQDFGFLRRGLVGTILQATGLPALFSNPYHFATAVQHVALAVLVGLTAWYFIRINRQAGTLFKAVVFFSPAFILQLAYTTGTLDVFVLILAAMNILFVRNLIVFSAILFVGPIVHELFLFTAPAQLTAYYIRRDCDLFRGFGRTIGLFLGPVTALAVATLIVAVFGPTKIPQAEYEVMMARLIPEAVGWMDYWSGYFEVGSSIGENSRTLSSIAVRLTRGFGYILIPVAYAAALGWLLLRIEPRAFPRLLLAASSVIPVLAYIVATDFHRWVGMSANMSLLLLMMYGARQPLPLGRATLIGVLAFSLCAPFGGAVLEKPLPMHAFALKKLGYIEDPLAARD